MDQFVEQKEIFFGLLADRSVTNSYHLNLLSVLHVFKLLFRKNFSYTQPYRLVVKMHYCSTRRSHTLKLYEPNYEFLGIKKYKFWVKRNLTENYMTIDEVFDNVEKTRKSCVKNLEILLYPVLKPRNLVSKETKLNKDRKNN